MGCTLVSWQQLQPEQEILAPSKPLVLCRASHEPSSLHEGSLSSPSATQGLQALLPAVPWGLLPALPGASAQPSSTSGHSVARVFLPAVDLWKIPPL